jgi:hypothetical protein
MEMTVHYRYECKTDFYVALDGGGSQVNMPPRLDDLVPGVRMFKVQGLGPFRVYDTDPHWTSLTAASEPCVLALETSSLQLAPSTIAQFEGHVAHYEKLAKVFSLVQNSAKTAGLLRNLVDQADLETLQSFWETLRLQIQSTKDLNLSPELAPTFDDILATMEFGAAENPSLEEGQTLQKKLKTQLDSFDAVVVRMGEEIVGLANPSYLEALKIASYAQGSSLSEGLKKLESNRQIFAKQS